MTLSNKTTKRFVEAMVKIIKEWVVKLKSRSVVYVENRVNMQLLKFISTRFQRHGKLKLDCASLTSLIADQISPIAKQIYSGQNKFGSQMIRLKKKKNCLIWFAFNQVGKQNEMRLFTMLKA
jgi:hypothetical protein